MEYIFLLIGALVMLLIQNNRPCSRCPYVSKNRSSSIENLNPAGKKEVPETIVPAQTNTNELPPEQTKPAFIDPKLDKFVNDQKEEIKAKRRTHNNYQSRDLQNFYKQIETIHRTNLSQNE